MRPVSSLSPHLPAQPTPLVDREDELATIRRLLAGEGARLLTLVGPAGVGKTRLALTAAADAQVADRFPDGVAVVDLAPVREPALVLPAIARALGLTDTGRPPLPERLRAVLRERATLLVLDNFEQVLPAAAVLAELLAACPGLRMLVTSRVPLQLRWERTLRVAPLPVPDLAAPLPPVEVLVEVPAMALFVERARARRGDFTVTERLAPLVAQLVARLDGLPLALELAAARLDVLPLPTLARRLGERLQLLASGAPDRPARQRSLEAAVGWSYDLLSEPERRLFRCLGVFAGRVPLDAIAAVAGALEGAGDEADEGRALEGLASLAVKSLVLAERPDEEDHEPAFGMLETVREYAWEQLIAEGELEAARRAHARYFLALAERADAELGGRDQRAWFLRLERERDNLRAALRWLLDRDGRDVPDAAAERTAGLRLAGALGWFWWLRGYHTEGRRWLEEALAHTPEVDPADSAAMATRIRVLLRAGQLLVAMADFEPARALEEDALALGRRMDDPAAIALAQTYLGGRATYAGAWAEGARLLREARAHWEALGDAEYLPLTLYFLSVAAAAQGDDGEAVAFASTALEQLEARGDLRLAGSVRFVLAGMALRHGDLLAATGHIRQAVHASVALRDRWLLSQGTRATLAFPPAPGDHDHAERLRLLGAAGALNQATGSIASVWERVAAALGATEIRELRQQLEREAGSAAYREGRSLPFEQVAELALSLLDGLAQAHATRGPAAAPARVPAPSKPSGLQTRREGLLVELSAREREVLRLVAEGLPSKAVGRRLFLSQSTVNYHLASVFHKLGVDTRAQAVAVAVQRGLLL